MTSLFLAPNVHLPTSCTPHLSIVVQDQTVHTHTTPIYDRSNHPPATNVTRSLEREAATRLLWRLPFEPDERMDPHHMRSAHRLVRRNTLVYYIYRNGTDAPVGGGVISYQVRLRRGNTLAQARHTPPDPRRLWTIPFVRPQLLGYMGHNHRTLLFYPHPGRHRESGYTHLRNRRKI